MKEHYRGRGVLYDEKGQRLEPVDYDFDLGIRRGAIGTVHSANRDLPKLTVLRLRLADPIHYLDVRVALTRPDQQRNLYEYAIHLSPDQPNDMYNVVTFNRTQRGIYTAVD
jgi:hypothetical protein